MEKRNVVINPNIFYSFDFLRKEFISAKPFPHVIIENFLNPSMFVNILKALEKEVFFEKNSDLFNFLQTNDFCNIKNTTLKLLRDTLINRDFINFIEELTKTKISQTKIDMSASLYKKGDYLLCHDDRLEKRKLAYIIYLSTLKKEDGGSLNLFSSIDKNPQKIEKKIFPKANSFMIFEVTSSSFHEVEEILRKNERISIAGWFYDRK